MAKKINTKAICNVASSIRLMRLPTVLQIIPLSKSAWWAGVKSGKFPKGIKLSSNVTAWKAADILRLAEDGL